MKRYLKIIFFGLILGISLVMIRAGLQIEQAVFMRGYWIISGMVILTAFLGNAAYLLFYHRKLQKLSELLNEEKPQEFLSGIAAMQKTAKGKTLQDVLSLNLAAGYLELKQFDRAILLLEEMAAKKLKGETLKLVHGLNLCMGYFETGQIEKGQALYGECEPLFAKYRNGKLYGANVAVVDILAAISREQYDQAEALLEAATAAYPGPRFQKAYCELAETVARHHD